MERFTDQVVMVTGCGTGIGSATALRFAKEGAAIVGVDISAEALKKTLAECEVLGARTLGIVRDVREPEGARKSVEQAVQAFKRLDVLVCSAGIYTGAPLADVALADWQKTIDINLTGIFLYNQAVLPVMIGRKSGSIINISSMAGKTSWDASAQYSASKSGVIGLTRSVAMELARYGATANALCPGNTMTPMVKGVAAVVGGRDGVGVEEWLRLRALDCPMKRLARPEEMAGIVAFLASEDSRYITGQSISADGGMIMY
jgi:NAD(P)-dependent dehydrogenase (short-subunit alcohol dehydrogenase family)